MTTKNIQLYCDHCDLDMELKIKLDTTNHEYEEELPPVEFCPLCGEVIYDDEEESELEHDDEDIL